MPVRARRSALPRVASLAPLPSRVSDFGPELARLERVHEARALERLATCRPREPLWFMTDPAHMEADAGGRGLGGDAKLHRLTHAFSVFDEEIIRREGTSGRSPQQQWFHREMTKAMLPQLYKGHFDDNIDKLFEQFACSAFSPYLIIMMARRKGKSWTVSMFVAALMYACGNQQIAIFSTGVRASRKLLDIIFHFVEQLPGYNSSWVRVNNKEDLWLCCDGAEGVSKCSSYPSHAQCARCERHFIERDNLGTWTCCYHPGALQDECASTPTTAAGHYTCCNTAPSRRLGAGNGCTPCDHVSDASMLHERVRVVSATDASAILVHASAPGVRFESETGQFYVFRCQDQLV